MFLANSVFWGLLKLHKGANRAVRSNKAVLLGSFNNASRAATRAEAISPSPSRAKALRKRAFTNLGL